MAPIQVCSFVHVYLSLTDGRHLALFDDTLSILYSPLTSTPAFWGSGEVTQAISFRSTFPRHNQSRWFRHWRLYQNR